MQSVFRGSGEKLEVNKGKGWQVIAIFKANIWIVEEFRGGVLVTLDADSSVDYRNVYLVDDDGVIKWQIEEAERLADPIHAEIRSSYSGITWKDGKLIAYATSGWVYEVDPLNGRRIGRYEYLK